MAGLKMNDSNDSTLQGKNMDKENLYRLMEILLLIIIQKTNKFIWFTIQKWCFLCIQSNYFVD